MPYWFREPRRGLLVVLSLRPFHVRPKSWLPSLQRLSCRLLLPPAVCCCWRPVPGGQQLSRWQRRAMRVQSVRVPAQHRRARLLALPPRRRPYIQRHLLRISSFTVFILVVLLRDARHRLLLHFSSRSCAGGEAGARAPRLLSSHRAHWHLCVRRHVCSVCSSSSCNSGTTRIPEGQGLRQHRARIRANQQQRCVCGVLRPGLLRQSRACADVGACRAGAHERQL